MAATRRPANNTFTSPRARVARPRLVNVSVRPSGGDELRGFFTGGVIGCAICLVLWPLMYFVGSHPVNDWSELTFRLGLVLWPTSIMLMAIQHPGMILLSVVVVSVAVLSNGLLYGLVF